MSNWVRSNMSLNMRLMFLAGLSLSLLARGVSAQTSYSQGETDGYNDNAPPGGSPTGSGDYARGYRNGQDDADDDDQDQMQRLKEMDRPAVPSTTPGLSDVAPRPPAPDLAPTVAPVSPVLQPPKDTTDSYADQ